MLKKNCKPMFFILLTPLYLLAFVCLIGMSMGSILWLRAFVYALVILIAAWGLSRSGSLLANLLGLACFIGLGAQLVYPVLTRSQHLGPWTISLYAGAFVALWGLGAFAYDVVKLVQNRT